MQVYGVGVYEQQELLCLGASSSSTMVTVRLEDRDEDEPFPRSSDGVDSNIPANIDKFVSLHVTILWAALADVQVSLNKPR